MNISECSLIKGKIILGDLFSLMNLSTNIIPFEYKNEKFNINSNLILGQWGGMGIGVMLNKFDETIILSDKEEYYINNEKHLRKSKVNVKIFSWFFVPHSRKKFLIVILQTYWEHFYH